MSYRVQSQTFKSLDQAKACAERAFRRTGNVVAITAVAATEKSEFERTGKLQRKIDVYYKAPGGLRYLHSTNWHKTCRDAKHAACREGQYAFSDLVANFAQR